MTKILVIEDDPVLKENLIDILQEESFQAIDASNGIVGLKLAKEHQPDLILCDVKIPHMDGYEVLANLKKNYYTSSIPFIFITSKTNRQSWRKGMELGADDYITKPFTPEEILKAIAIRSNCSSSLHKNITIEKHQILELQQVFEFDNSTDLLCKFALQTKFEELVKNYLLVNVNSWRKKGNINFKIPFLCVNINNFAGLIKLLNDKQKVTLYKTIAERLSIGTFARGIVTHLEEGMYVVVLPSVEQKKDVITIVQRIHKYLVLPLEHHTNLPQFFLDISTGISFYPNYGTSIYTLIKQAKTAVELAKNKSDDYAFYQPQQHNNFISSFTWKKNIIKDFPKNFQILYQPRICLKTNRVVSSEATISGRYPKYSYLLAKLISSKNYKTIASINIWLWQQACKQLKTWQQKEFKSFRLSLKVAKEYFYQDTFNLDLAKLIQKYRLGYGVLEIEISEQCLLHDKQQALEKLNGLSNLGIYITLDKFTSGYTNLEYWQEFPINNVKISWQNLQKTSNVKRRQQIIHATAKLAHSKGIKAIATDIETSQDLQFFIQHQWDMAQGSYWSKPLTALKFIELFGD